MYEAYIYGEDGQVSTPGLHGGPWASQAPALGAYQTWAPIGSAQVPPRPPQVLLVPPGLLLPRAPQPHPPSSQSLIFHHRGVHGTCTCCYEACMVIHNNLLRCSCSPISIKSNVYVHHNIPFLWTLPSMRSRTQAPISLPSVFRWALDKGAPKPSALENTQHKINTQKILAFACCSSETLVKQLGTWRT